MARVSGGSDCKNSPRGPMDKAAAYYPGIVGSNNISLGKNART